MKLSKIIGVDSYLPQRCAEAIQSDYLGFAYFISMFDCPNNQDLYPYLQKALSKWDIYHLQKVQRMRLNIEVNLIKYELDSLNDLDQKNAVIKISNLIKEVNDSKSKAMADKNMIVLYLLYLKYLESTENNNKYVGNYSNKNRFNSLIEIAESYLELAMKHERNVCQVWDIFHSTINRLFHQKNFKKASDLADKELDFLDQNSWTDKCYVDALYIKFVSKRHLKDIEYMTFHIDSLLDETKNQYGENSINYIRAINEMAYYKIEISQFDESKVFLK